MLYALQKGEECCFVLIKSTMGCKHCQLTDLLHYILCRWCLTILVRSQFCILSLQLYLILLVEYRLIYVHMPSFLDFQFQLMCLEILDCAVSSLKLLLIQRILMSFVRRKLRSQECPYCNFYLEIRICLCGERFCLDGGSEKN